MQVQINEMIMIPLLFWGDILITHNYTRSIFNNITLSLPLSSIQNLALFSQDTSRAFRPALTVRCQVSEVPANSTFLTGLNDQQMWSSHVKSVYQLRCLKKMVEIIKICFKQWCFIVVRLMCDLSPHSV